MIRTTENEINLHRIKGHALIRDIPKSNIHFSKINLIKRLSNGNSLCRQQTSVERKNVASCRTHTEPLAKGWLNDKLMVMTTWVVLRSITLHSAYRIQSNQWGHLKRPESQTFPIRTGDWVMFALARLSYPKTMAFFRRNSLELYDAAMASSAGECQWLALGGLDGLICGERGV